MTPAPSRPRTQPRLATRLRRRPSLRLVAAALLAVTALILAACGGDDDDGATGDDATGNGAADALRPVTLMLNWTPNAHHLGIYAAEQQGWYEEAGLDVEIVEPAGEGVDPAVATGRADFGISVAESVLPAREAGLPVVSVATILPSNDSSLMALAEDGIERPRDLEGTTYGGFGGALETELISTLVSCDGGDPDSITFVEIGNVDYLAGMEQDRYDFVWVFSGWDGLRATEVEGVDITEIRFADHLDCIPDWYTPLIVTSEEILADDPGLVEAFLEATARGYDLAVDDPQAAADLLLAAAPELDEDLVRESADYYGPRFTAEGQPWGVQSDEIWEEFGAFVLQAGLLDEAIDTSAAFTDAHLPGGSG